MTISKVIERKSRQHMERLKKKEEIKRIQKQFTQIAINHKNVLEEHFYVIVNDYNDPIIAISNSRICKGSYSTTYNIALKSYSDLALHVGWGSNSAKGDIKIKIDTGMSRTRLTLLFKQALEKIVSDCYDPYDTKV